MIAYRYFFLCFSIQLFMSLPLMTEAGEVRHLKADKAIEAVQADAPGIIDIRTPEEYAEGHLPGAANIDFYSSDFGQRLSQLDRQKTWLVYCRSGNRSGKSLKKFKKLGFENVLHLRGGYSAWTRAKGPTVQ